MEKKRGQTRVHDKKEKKNGAKQTATSYRSAEIKKWTKHTENEIKDKEKEKENNIWMNNERVINIARKERLENEKPPANEKSEDNKKTWIMTKEQWKKRNMENKI